MEWRRLITGPSHQETDNISQLMLGFTVFIMETVISVTRVMKILAQQIAKELEKANHCSVYEPELSRVWPHNGIRLEGQVEAFAKQHGWRVRFYKDGFCAIFDKLPR